MNIKSIILCTLLPLLALACKKADENKSGGAYNGFKIDGVVYNLDTIEHDFSYTTGALRIYSKDNGGGLVYLRCYTNNWPSADGTYQYTIGADNLDTTEAHVCYEPDGQYLSYCSMIGPSVSTKLTVTISGGKWSLSLPPTKIIDNTQKTLEISASE